MAEITLSNVRDQFDGVDVSIPWPVGSGSVGIEFKEKAVIASQPRSTSQCPSDIGPGVFAVYTIVVENRSYYKFKIPIFIIFPVGPSGYTTNGTHTFIFKIWCCCKKNKVEWQSGPLIEDPDPFHQNPPPTIGPTRITD